MGMLVRELKEELEARDQPIDRQHQGVAAPEGRLHAARRDRARASCFLQSETDREPS